MQYSDMPVDVSKITDGLRTAGQLDDKAIQLSLRQALRSGHGATVISALARLAQSDPADDRPARLLASLLSGTEINPDSIGWLHPELVRLEQQLAQLRQDAQRQREALVRLAHEAGVEHRNRLAGRHRPGMRVRRPVFVIGCGRSGTALICNLLAEHPDLVPTRGYPDGEDHVGWIEHGHCAISGLGASPEVDRGHTGYHCCPHMNEWDVTPLIVESMHRHYLENVLAGDTSRRVINKNPHLSNKLRFVRQIFPDACFVHIVRDVAPVVSSWIKEMDLQRHQMLHWPQADYPCFSVLPRPEDPVALRALARDGNTFPGGGLMRLVDYWMTVNTYIPSQLSDTPAQLTTVRYEDVLANPDETIARVFEFVGLDPSVPRRLAVRADNNAKHRTHLGPELIGRIEGRAASVRERYGYA